MILFMDVIGLESCSGLLEGILSESSDSALQPPMAKGIPTYFGAIDRQYVNLSCRMVIIIAPHLIYTERHPLIFPAVHVAAYLRLVI